MHAIRLVWVFKRLASFQKLFETQRTLQKNISTKSRHRCLWNCVYLEKLIENASMRNEMQWIHLKKEGKWVVFFQCLKTD